MNFEPSAKTKELQQRLQKFMDAHVYPNEQRFDEEMARESWQPTRIIEELKLKARARGTLEFIFAARSTRRRADQP